jgi:hypothetical protein
MGCALCLDYSQKKDFPQINLFLHSAKTPEELLLRALFPHKVAPAKFSGRAY